MYEDISAFELVVYSVFIIIYLNCKWVLTWCWWYYNKTTKQIIHKTKKTKLRGLSPRANCTDRAAAASRRSYCQLLRIEGVA
jgi:hypothetical protein